MAIIPCCCQGNILYVVRAIKWYYLGKHIVYNIAICLLGLLGNSYNTACVYCDDNYVNDNDNDYFDSR